MWRVRPRRARHRASLDPVPPAPHPRLAPQPTQRPAPRWGGPKTARGGPAKTTRPTALRAVGLKAGRAWAIKESLRRLWNYRRRGWGERHWRKCSGGCREVEVGEYGPACLGAGGPHLGADLTSGSRRTTLRPRFS